MRAGLSAAARNAWLLWWLLSANLAVSLCAVVPLLSPLEKSLSHHEASLEMTARFDMSWWVDVTTEHAEAFARALDGVAAAAFVSAILGCFFAGGLLQAYHDTLGLQPLDRFMTSCRRWFLRFAWLFVLSLPLYWLAHRLINTHMAVALDTVLERVEDERVGLLITWARAAIFLLLFDLITLFADYARVHAVVSGQVSMLACLSAGGRFVLSHPWRIWTMEGCAVGAQALALTLYVPLDAALDRSSTASLIAGFVCGQSFLLMRLFLRESARAGQVALYREHLVSASWLP